MHPELTMRYFSFQNCWKSTNILNKNIWILITIHNSKVVSENRECCKCKTKKKIVFFLMLMVNRLKYRNNIFSDTKVTFEQFINIK